MQSQKVTHNKISIFELFDNDYEHYYPSEAAVLFPVWKFKGSFIFNESRLNQGCM